MMTTLTQHNFKFSWMWYHKMYIIRYSCIAWNSKSCSGHRGPSYFCHSLL